MVAVHDRRIQLIRIQSQLEELMAGYVQRDRLTLAEQIRILADMVTDRARALAADESDHLAEPKEPGS